MGIGPEIEARAHELVERVVSGGLVEDSLVECKSSWIEGHKAARLIAGHCNAAGGQPIIWIIGLDEKAHKVTGSGSTDLANWWRSIQSKFDQEAPAVDDLRVNTSHGTVTVLQFDTARAPFVVKSSGGAQIDREVPWREATGTRSAHRGDLLRILVPRSKAPILEAVVFEVDVRQQTQWRLVAEIFITSDSPRSVFPSHRLGASLVFPGVGVPLQGQRIHLKMTFEEVGYIPDMSFYRSGTRPPDPPPVPGFGSAVRQGDAFISGAGRIKANGSAEWKLPTPIQILDIKVLQAQVVMEEAFSGETVQLAVDVFQQSGSSSQDVIFKGPKPSPWLTWP